MKNEEYSNCKAIETIREIVVEFEGDECDDCEKSGVYWTLNSSGILEINCAHCGECMTMVDEIFIL